MIRYHGLDIDPRSRAERRYDADVAAAHAAYTDRMRAAGLDPRNDFNAEASAAYESGVQAAADRLRAAS
jgi:hypothetical protein